VGSWALCCSGRIIGPMDFEPEPEPPAQLPSWVQRLHDGDEEIRRLYERAKRRFHGQAKRYLGRTAYHEAGHAVAAVALKLAFDWVAVRPLDDNNPDADLRHMEGGERLDEFSYGTVTIHPLTGPDLVARCEAAHIVVLAGPVAEFCYMGARAAFGSEGRIGSSWTF
jgi:hypothetical protein